MLANDLAEAIAYGAAAVVSVGRLRRELLGLSTRVWRRFGEGTDFVDRADADSIGLA
jgi:hypothetical protein